VLAGLDIDEVFCIAASLLFVPKVTRLKLICL